MSEAKRIEEVSVPVPVEAVDLGGKNLIVSNQKKKRRTWSTHMHREFVDALHRLGGPNGTYISAVKLHLVIINKFIFQFSQYIALLVI